MASHRSTRPDVRHAADLAEEILHRARQQARHGAVDGRRAVATGLPALDVVVSRWYGVSLLLGPEDRAKTALAARIAFETARSGRPVTWLCAGGLQDRALLLMMCWLAAIEPRRVFVKRDLRASDWRRLQAAAVAVSQLPLRLADAHGADADELEDALCRSVSATGVQHQLVVIDHLDAPPRQMLPHLERLSETTMVPMLVILDVEDAVDRPYTVHETGLRPGSLLLFLQRATHNAAHAQGAGPGEGDLVLRVRGIGTGRSSRLVPITYDRARGQVHADLQVQRARRRPAPSRASST